MAWNYYAWFLCMYLPISFANSSIRIFSNKSKKGLQIMENEIEKSHGIVQVNDIQSLRSQF